MPAEQARISREKRTVRAMIGIYCRAHHGTSGHLCSQCDELLKYATERLDRCPFGGQKPTCADCPVHCYKPAMREAVKRVMRHAGPRLIFKHPILAVQHFIDGLRRNRQS